VTPIALSHERPTLFTRRRRPRIRNSLKARMVAGFLTVSTVVGAALALLVYHEAADALRLNISNRLEGVSVRRVADVNHWVAEQRELLRFVGGIPSLASDASTLAAARQAGRPADVAVRDRLTRLLDSAKANGVAANELTVLSAVGGEVLASTVPTHVGGYRVEDPYFTEGLKGPYVQNIYPSPLNGRPTFTASTPVRDAGGRVVGVLVAHLTLREIDELLMQSGSGFPVEVYLVNALGEFVSSERFGRAEFRRGVTSKGIAAALAGHTGLDVYSNYRGERVIGVYRWMPERELALLVEVPESEAFAPARRLLFALLIGGALAVTVLSFGVYAVTRRVAEPILTTARAAERLAAGDFEAHAPVVTQDEVGILATSFNEMTSRLRSLYSDLQGQVHATQSALVALRQNQALVQGLVDNSATLVLVMDVSGRCILANTRLEELFGLGRGTCAGRMLGDMLPDNAGADFLEMSAEVVARRAVVEREMKVATAQGERSLLAVCFPVDVSAGSTSAVGVIATDVTERQRAADERRAFEANVQHAQKLESLGVMAGGIAHDFNNLLVGVLGNAELALLSMDNRDQVRRSLEQVMVAARRAADLTRQMLAYAGRASFQRETVDVNALVREISALAMTSLSKKARLDLNLSDDRPSILADPAQVSQVVLNLLTNASDAIGDAPGSVTVRTQLSTTLPQALAESWPSGAGREGPFVLLSVEDTGCGMTEQTRHRIFEPFFTSKQTGRGLGLSAVLGIVRGIGGSLAVRSTVGAGTCFSLAFPASAANACNAQATPDRPGRGRRRNATVLVVDDEEMVRSVTRRSLDATGFDVIEAADGHQAVAVFGARRGEISAVVLDFTMPGMSGEEALAAIRQMDREVPVVMASGYALELDSSAMRSDARVRFLQKPFGRRDLVNAIEELSRN
jgi:PAS domain S-box-containing protein